MPIVQALEVQTRSGPRLIKLEEGDIFGELVVHRTVMAPATWTITHADSGYALLTDLPGQEAAREAASRLLPMADWTLVSPSGFPARATNERLKRELRLIKQQHGN